jgi:hypothetical protein
MLGGGNHGHAGIIVEPAKYLTMTGGTQFDPPANPGVYPAGLTINAAAGTRTKENKQNKLTARQFKANAIDEQAEATEELIHALTEYHRQQMEVLICSTTEAMKEMMALVKENNKDTTNSNNEAKEQKTKRQEKQKKYRDAPVCKHCNRKHPNQQESECWELESNANSRPTWWKSSKST